MAGHTPDQRSYKGYRTGAAGPFFLGWSCEDDR